MNFITEISLAWGNLPTLFWMVQFPTLCSPLSLDWRFATHTQNSNRYYLKNR